MMIQVFKKAKFHSSAFKKCLMDWEGLIIDLKISPGPVVTTVVDELIVNVGVDPVTDGGTVSVVMIVVALDGV